MTILVSIIFLTHSYLLLYLTLSQTTTDGVKLVLIVMADVISYPLIHTAQEAMEDSWEVLVYMATLPNVYMNLLKKFPFHKLVEASLSTGTGTIVWHQDLQTAGVLLTMVFQLLLQLVIRRPIQHQLRHLNQHQLQHQTPR